MNNKFENKVVQVENGTKYFVVKELIYKDKMYLIANELVNDTNLGEDIYVLCVNNDEENLKLVMENDLLVMKEVLEKAAELM